MSLKRTALALIVASIVTNAASATGPSVPHHPVIGVASWYGRSFDHRRTADGQAFNKTQLTAASPNLPLSSLARVTNLANGRSVAVRITDRGPHVPGRVLDVSERTAFLLGFKQRGLAWVRVEVVSG
jgi:rare lipoprotein A